MFRGLFLACGLAAAAAAQPAVVVNLPTGFDAWNLSGDGAVVVGEMRSDQSPAIWTEEAGIRPLRGPNNEFIRGRAFAANADGAVVVGAMILSAQVMVPFRWTPETGVMPLASDPFDYLSIAYAVSDDGSVVVGSSGIGGNPPGFTWNAADGLRNLAGPTGYFGGAVTAVCGDGRFAAGSVVLASDGPFVRWDLQTLQPEFLTLPGNPNYRLIGLVGDCTGDGQVIVGNAAGPVQRDQPVIWTANRVEFLGEARGLANRVSSDGLVIGGTTDLFSGSAWTWTQGLGIVDLKTYLRDYHGLSLPANRRLYRVMGVSADGRAMAGRGDPSSWHLRLPPARLADFNRDESVDSDDLGAFLSCFDGSSLLPPSSADLNHDGITDFFDLIAFMDDFER